MGNINELLGKTLASIEVNKEKDAILFTTYYYLKTL
jgi:hypothetical protein